MAPARKIIALDFDGTLLETSYESFLTAARTYKEFTGKDLENPVNAKRYARGRGFSLNAESNYTLTKIIDENPEIDFVNFTQEEFDIKKAQNKGIGEEYAKRFGENRKKFAETKEWFEIQKPFEGIKEMISEWSSNYQVYITTTKKLWSVLALLKHHGINFAEEKIISDHAKETKEHLLLRVAELEKVPISQVILIDDALKQAIFAKQAGAKAILAMWGEKRKSFEEGAKKEEILIAYNPDDCLKIVKSL